MIQKFEQYLKPNLNESFSFDFELESSYTPITANKEKEELNKEKYSKLIKSVEGEVIEENADLTIKFTNGDSIEYFYEYNPSGKGKCYIKTMGKTYSEKFIQEEFQSNYWAGYKYVTVALFNLYLDIKLGILK